jgi:Tol biopolymer transport system component
VKRSIALLVVSLSLIAGPAFPFGQNKIVYDKFHWSIYHSTHFDVYFYDEEKPSLQKVVDTAESAYDDLSRKLNYQIAKKIPLMYYATHSTFEQTNVDLNFIPEGVGAFAEPTRNRMVIPIDTTDEKLLQLISHELTHIFEYEILFQGKLGKTLTANPPTWLMEGLASFMGQDEDSKDRMILRDAVVTDQVPAITRNPQGYFAYRFGHAVFHYMQQKYGWEGLRDFIYEYRNTLGSSVDKALKRAFDVTPDEFDTRFRGWLRKQYLPALIAKGEPQEYGDPFKIAQDVRSQEVSPVPSPSGDLLAAFTTYKDDVDIVLFNIPDRKLLRNLSPGYTSRYEYLIAQSFTIGPVMGRDVAWSPSGDQIALFVKRERGRNLLLINPLTGTIEKSVPMIVDQQLSPAYSPDGKWIAFAGYLGNQPDIFLYSTATGEVQNLTNDRFFDGAPVFSPDGKWLIYSSVVDGYAKLFKLNIAKPSERYQITTGAWNDIDAYFSPDGKRIFFASDRQTGRGVEEATETLHKADLKAEPRGEAMPPPDPMNFASYNIYSLNLENGDVLQYTDVVGGVFTPVVFIGQNNKERMVFSSYYKQNWRLFSTLTDKPLHPAEHTTLPSGPMLAESRKIFQPPVEVAIDPEKIENAHNHKLFIDDVEVNAGVSSDQLFVSRSVIYMSDMLGDRRFIASLDSVSSFSNFDFLYFDLHKRLNWGVRLFDNRSFYTAQSVETGLNNRVKQAYRETGAIGILSYPFTRYHRIDMGAGYESRDIAYPFLTNVGGVENLSFFDQKDSFPLVTTSFSGDTAVFKEFGPISGRRYDLGLTYAPDIKRHGTLTNDVTMDFRQYVQLSSRTLLAARVFTGYSTGNFPNFYYFGGLNTLRGYDFRSIFGTKAGFANIEFRFPLIDYIATPILAFQGVRGNLFLDVGAAALKGQPYQFLKGGRLKDGLASIGYGFSFNFLGLELHFDFARHFDGRHTVGNSHAQFWIGETF